MDTKMHRYKNPGAERTLFKTIAESSEAGFASDLQGLFIKQIPPERIVFEKSSGSSPGFCYCNMFLIPTSPSEAY